MAEPIELSIADAAKKGPDAVTAYIRGDAQSERAAQVDRAHEALDGLKGDTLGIAEDKKKPIVKAIIGQLDKMKLGTLKEKASTDPNLQELEKRLQEAKDKALAQERAMAVGTEVVTNEAREVFTDLKKMNMDSAKSAALYLGIPAALGYLAYSLFGKGDGTRKPGIVRRLFSWIAGGVAGVGAFMAARIGMRAFNDVTGAIGEAQNLPKQAKAAFDQVASLVSKNAGPAKPAVDVGIGGMNALNKNVVNVTDALGTNAKFVSEMIKQGNIKDALVYAVQNGGGVLFENGRATLNFLGETFLLPAESVGKIGEWLATGEQPEDFWLVYGEAGAAYLIGRAALNLMIYGKNPIPKTKFGKVMSVAKVALGPAVAVNDALKFGSRVFTAGGRDALRIRFASQAWPARLLDNVSRFNRQFLNLDINSQSGLLKTVERCLRLEKDIALMKKHGAGMAPIFEGKHDAFLQRAEGILKDEIDRLKNGLTVIEDSKLTDPRLQELKLHVGNDDTAFKGKMTRIMHTVKPDAHQVQTPGETPIDPEAETETETETDTDARGTDDARGYEPEARSAASPTDVDPAVMAMQERIGKLEEDFKRQSEELKKLNDGGAEKDTEIKTLTEKLGETERELQTERARLTSELAQQMQTQGTLRSDIATLQGQLKEAVNTGAARSQEALRLEGEINAKNATLAEMQQRYDAAKVQLDAEATAHAKEVASLKADLNTARGTTDEFLKTLQGVEAENAALKQRLDAAERRAADAETKAKNSAESGTRANPTDAQRRNPGEPRGAERPDTRYGPLDPNDGSQETAGRSNGRGDAGTGAKKPSPKPTLPGGESTPADPSNPTRRPERRTVRTDVDVTGQVKQDQGFGKVDLRRGKSDPRGTDVDSKTDIKLKK